MGATSFFFLRRHSLTGVAAVEECNDLSLEASFESVSHFYLLGSSALLGLGAGACKDRVGPVEATPDSEAAAPTIAC